MAIVAINWTTLPISVLLASSRWITCTAVSAARTAAWVAVAMSLLTLANRCTESRCRSCADQSVWAPPPPEDQLSF